MSTGYSGNYGYAMPKNWAFDQFNEITFSGVGFDKDAVSGRDNGVSLDTRYINYDRNAAREYASRWWNDNSNPDYYHYHRGDCANFVSQCLVAGGIPMNEAWYSHKPSDNEEMTADMPQNATFDVGEPWRLAKPEYEYFKNIDCGYRNGDIIEITSTADIPGILAKCAAEGKPIQTGDLMYFAHKGEGEDGVHHATMISYADLDCIKYTAHTDPQFDEDLRNKNKENQDHLDREDVFIIRMKNSN